MKETTPVEPVKESSSPPERPKEGGSKLRARLDGVKAGSDEGAEGPGRTTSPESTAPQTARVELPQRSADEGTRGPAEQGRTVESRPTEGPAESAPAEQPARSSAEVASTGSVREDDSAPVTRVTESRPAVPEASDDSVRNDEPAAGIRVAESRQTTRVQEPVDWAAGEQIQVSRGSVEAPPRVEQAERDPQAEHFRNRRAGIGNAPAEGLADFLNNERLHGGPESRFRFERNQSKGNICENWFVHDEGPPPETWMLKQTAESDERIRAFRRGMGATEPVPDVLNERMAASVMDDAGFPMPETRWASSPSAEYPWLVQRHLVEQLEPAGRALDNVDPAVVDIRADGSVRFTDSTIERLRRGADPEAVTRMVLFDYLVNNTIDRHLENFMLVESPKDGSLRLGIIDHGLAFGGWDSSEPQTQSFVAWHRGDYGEAYRADTDTGGFNASQAALRVAGSPEALETQVRQALEGFDRVDPDAILEQLRADGITGRQERLASSWMEQFAKRREWLRDNVDEVVEVMVNRAARA